MIKEYKKDYLAENYQNYIDNGEDTISLREYTELEAESDPGFFGWLFDDGYIEDYDGLSEEQKEQYKDFLEEL